MCGEVWVGRIAWKDDGLVGPFMVSYGAAWCCCMGVLFCMYLLPEVDQVPHLEVPYPLVNGGQQLRHASGRCPDHHQSVT